MVTSNHPPGHVNGRLFSDAAHPTVLVTDFDVPGYLAAARGRITVDAAHLDLGEAGAEQLRDGPFSQLDFTPIMCQPLGPD